MDQDDAAALAWLPVVGQATVDRRTAAAVWWHPRLGLPFPEHQPPCSWCGRTAWLIRQWRYFTHKGVDSRRPWRIDVEVKCTFCARVEMFGLSVPKWRHDQWAGYHKRGLVRWHDVRQKLLAG